jgi:hypothetical protein
LEGAVAGLVAGQSEKFTIGTQEYVMAERAGGINAWIAGTDTGQGCLWAIGRFSLKAISSQPAGRYKQSTVTRSLPFRPCPIDQNRFIPRRGKSYSVAGSADAKDAPH